MSRKKETTNEFILKARAVHGDKYNYDKAVYKGNNEKVIITCPIHGDFEITPHNHKAGHGCDKCAKLKQLKERRMAKEEFITRASIIHNNKYNYSLSEIKGNNKTKVKIKCNTCGTVFEQKINNHLNGQGCPECAKERNAETLRKLITSRRITKEYFTKKAVEKHGDKYDYSLVGNVKNNRTKVRIKCNTCGSIFEQGIGNHLNGNGCPECARKRNIKAITGTADEFIADAKEIHGDKYCYDKVKYINAKIPVTITCPIHGDFPQTPHNHKAGCGCPKCNQSHLEEQTRILLEQNNIKYESQQKFPWLLSNKDWPMKLDFYLPEYNIAIECQGIQHFLTDSNGYFSTEDVMGTQQRDKLKYKLCQDNGIQIFYINYNDKVEEAVGKLISNLKQVVPNL